MFLFIAILPKRFNDLANYLLYTLRWGLVGGSSEYHIPGSYRNNVISVFPLGHLNLPDISDSSKFTDIRSTVCQAALNANQLQADSNGTLNVGDKKVDKHAGTLLTLSVIAALKRHEGIFPFPEDDNDTQKQKIRSFVADVFNSSFDDVSAQSSQITPIVDIATSVIHDYENAGFYLTPTKNLQNALTDFNRRLKNQSIHIPSDDKRLVLFLATWTALQKYKMKDLSLLEVSGFASPIQYIDKTLKIEPNSRAFKYCGNMLNSLGGFLSHSSVSENFIRSSDKLARRIGQLDIRNFGGTLIQNVRTQFAVDSDSEAFLINCALMGAKYRSFAEKPQPNVDVIQAINRNARGFLNLAPNDLNQTFSTGDTMVRAAKEVIDEFENAGNHLTHPSHFKNAIRSFHGKMLFDADYRMTYQSHSLPEKNHSILAIFMSAWTAYQEFNTRPISNDELGVFYIGD